MEHWWEWGLSILGSGAVSAALLGCAGYLFRAQLSHLLNKDLELLKAKHQRDLEAYKVGLIAETERAKANQALKTAAAMKIVEKKYSAIDALHSSTIGLSKLVYSISRSDFKHRTKETIDDMRKRIDAFDAARDRIGPFVGVEGRATLFAFKTALYPIMKECFRMEGALLSESEAKALAKVAIDAELAVDQLMEKLIADMANLDS